MANRARALVSCLVLGLLVAALGSGCHLYRNDSDDTGDGDDDDAPPPPPPPPDCCIPQPTSCDPLAAPGLQGCATGQKCAWVTVQDNPEEIGALRCVPDGDVAVGGTCTRGAAGETTGFDNCAAGSTCIGGACQDLCGFDGSAGAACAAGYACTRYSGLFANGDDDPIAGACAPSCDPLTQTITGGGACGPGQGCYLLTSSVTTVAVCAGAGTVAHNQPITGVVFANSCLPAHQPRRAVQDGTTFECGALCRPAPVTVGMNVADEGGVAPFTCESRGAAPPDSATAGESCRYLWAREPFTDPSPFSNAVGFCWKHATWRYDSDGDQVPDAPWPRCITLTHGDVVPPIGNPPHDDAVFFWCVPFTSSLQGGPRGSRLPPAAAPRLDRLGGWR